MGNTPSSYHSPQLSQYPWYPPDEAEGNRRIATSAYCTHYNMTCIHCKILSEHLFTTSIETLQGLTFRRVYHFCTQCRRKSTCEQVWDSNAKQMEVFTTYLFLMMEREREMEGKGMERAGAERAVSRVPPVAKTGSSAGFAQSAGGNGSGASSGGVGFWGC